MPQQKKQQVAPPRIHDDETTYGWVSIAFHWLSTVIVIALLFFGKSISIGPPEDADNMRQLHVSLAASAWLLILLRVMWRIHSGHPHIDGLSLRVHRVAKAVHYTMLIALLCMLFSGPLLVWSSGQSINLFGWLTIPGPIGASDSVRAVAWFMHTNAAMVLLLLVLLHIAGALKHLMFNSDDTLARMLWPGRQTKVIADQ